MKKTGFLFSPVFMGILFFLFAFSMAVATFIENDYGREAAYASIYNTFWFELIMLLLAVNLTGQIFIHRLYRKEKITVMGFHLAFVVMLAGAALTRYTGYEGTMHIREGNEVNTVYSAVKYIGYTLRDEKGNVLSEKYEKYSSGKYERKINENLTLRLTGVIPDATEKLEDNPAGTPVISFMVSSSGMGMNTLILKEGDTAKTDGVTISFNTLRPADLNITADSTGFYLTASAEAAESGMMKGERKVYKPGEKIRIRQMQVIQTGNIRVVPVQFTLKGIVMPVPAAPGEQGTGRNALVFHLFGGDKTRTITLWDNQEDYFSTASVSAGSMTIDLFFGSRITNLPFSVRLDDFILERYPGSNAPSGYKSNVMLIDPSEGISKPFSIFMNNVLKYKGYRFYQASYDRDEKGTILSVNHDVAGMMVTYTGYALLFFFIILSLLNRNSLFRKANISYWQSPFGRRVTAFAIMLAISGFAGLTAQQKYIPDSKAADVFGHVLVQDQKGRTEPLYTLSSDILRKVTHKNSFEGLNPVQVFLGIYFDFTHWQNVPLIRVSNSTIAGKIGIKGNMAAFSDIVDFKNNGYYKLGEDVQKAYSKRPAERNKFDKEVIKTDERVNIVYMIYSGEFMRLFPLRDSLGTWGNSETALKRALSHEDSLYLGNILPMFAEAAGKGDRQQVSKIAETISEYQRRFAGYALPSERKTAAEVFFVKAGFFEKLFPFYATVGLIMLAGLIILLMRGAAGSRLFNRVAIWLLSAGFLVHTAGLALRWYVSGHAPMSNGYESMVFISWVTMLAGLIFSRKSPFVLPATAVLSAMTLLVAHMSFMDPEITNLVPVLKSYWLTLHVSVITSSYAFLGMGAVLGLIVMILLSLTGPGNIKVAGAAIESLTVINYRTLTVGLYLLTIGTFLGAIWANESWGRYWGWDPKETWSLITIIVYSFVTHSKMIPSFRNIYSFNLMSLFAFSSVLMTYFGVNYYLSGLHSYAGGDPVPVPVFVYVAVIVLAGLSAVAYMKYKKWDKEAAPERSA